jgi:ATP-binding cassette, subfamily B, bacterial
MTATSPNAGALKALVRACWDATHDERGRFYLFVGLFVLSNLLDLGVPWAIGYTLEIFVTHGFTETAYTLSLWGVLAYLVLRLSHTACHHFARYYQTTTAYSARMNSLHRIFSAFMKFPLNWHVRTHSGENLSKLHRSAGAVDSTIGTFVWQVIEGSVKIVFASGAIFFLDVYVAINVAVICAITIYTMIHFNTRLTHAIRNNNSFVNKVNRICVDYLFHIVTVKTLGLERSATDYLGNQKKEGLSYSRKISRYSELKWGTTATGSGLVIGTSLFIYFYGHRGVQFEIAEVYVLLDYLNRIFHAVGSFTAYYGGIIEASIAYEDGRHLIDEADRYEREKVAFDVDHTWQVLSARNLTFSYNVGDRPGLRDLSIDIFRGEKIALVGPSGGGKSTFLKVLGGLLSPQTYSLYTDVQPDIPISQINQISLLVPQEPEVFSESLYYNLTMGEWFDPAEISRFISLCKLSHVIEKLSEGIETYLAENGLNLSVGEKQRVALARGLLRAGQREILLLDEPTSSLDPKTEKEIFYGLLSHFKERTIITACHRLNLVPLFDKVIYVANGKVEEVGTFQELIDAREGFFRAWDDYERKVGSDS